MSEASLKAMLQFSEELLCRPPEQRNEGDILRILPWIRHKSSLFKNLEDGKYAEFVLIFVFVVSSRHFNETHSCLSRPVVSYKEKIARRES